MLEIRDAGQADSAAVLDIYPLAFPDEDLIPLASTLLDGKHGEVSLVAQTDEELVGHICFSPCLVEDDQRIAWLLGPLAVRPDFQSRGVGKALIAQGIEHAQSEGVAKLLLLGSPDYYARSGFSQEMGLMPAYRLKHAWLPAWQSRALVPCDDWRGELIFTPPWQNKAYWS